MDWASILGGIIAALVVTYDLCEFAQNPAFLLLRCSQIPPSRRFSVFSYAASCHVAPL